MASACNDDVDGLPSSRWARLLPSQQITPEEVERGLRAGHWEASFSTSMFSLIGGTFLSGWALQQGASMTYLGLLNAAGAAAVIVQLPAIWLAARMPMRKLFWASTQAIGRLLWMLIALLPLVVSTPDRMRAATLAMVYLAFILMNLGGPAWTSWLRDFVPENRMGRHLGTRTATGLVVGSAVGILGGLFVDIYKGHPQLGPCLYNILFAVGSLAGVTGILMALVQPEPHMEPVRSSILKLIAEPLRDLNFRRYLHFMIAWGLAGFLALPFTTAYMLQRLHLDMRWAVSMAMLSQIMTAIFLPMWGRLADRFTSKSVLSVSCPLFLLPYPFWLLAANVHSDLLRNSLVVALHLIFGLANGGMVVATTSLLMKFAPRGRAATYGGLNATTIGLAAMLSPWMGGQLADRLKDFSLTFSISLATPSMDRLLPVVQLSGLDYVFLAALLGGLYGWHRLLAVREEGEVEEPIILGAMVNEVWSGIRLAHHHARRGFDQLAGRPQRQAAKETNPAESEL